MCGWVGLSGVLMGEAEWCVDGWSWAVCGWVKLSGVWMGEVIASHFEKNHGLYSLGKMSNLGWKISCELNTPFERAHFEQLNTFLKLDISNSWKLLLAELNNWFLRKTLSIALWVYHVSVWPRSHCYLAALPLFSFLPALPPAMQCWPTKVCGQRCWRFPHWDCRLWEQSYTGCQSCEYHVTWNIATDTLLASQTTYVSVVREKQDFC